MEGRNASSSGSTPSRRHSTDAVRLPHGGYSAAMRRATVDTPSGSTRRYSDEETRNEIRRLHYALQQAQAASAYLQERERTGARNSGTAQNTSAIRFAPIAEETLPALLQPPGPTAGPPLVQDQQALRTRVRARQREIDNAEIAWAHAGEGRVRHAVRRTLAFFGYGTGNRHRRELVSLVWTICFGSIQFAFCVSFIAFSAVHRSPTVPQFSEWKACDKPLGIWACLWIFKIGLDCCMTYWGYKRDWKLRQREENELVSDPERGSPTAEQGGGDPPADDALDFPESSEAERRRRRLAALPFSKLYSRLSLLLTFVMVAWFLTANVLVFTSLHTCRFAAPHLWWLIFALLCVQYIVILEIILIAMLIFIVGPLIYLFWNIFLIIVGRHPIQNPHFINPEVGKLPKGAVEKIPLVLYIPSPPDEDQKETGGGDAIAKPEAAHIADSGAEHTYPPKQPLKGRFQYLRRVSSKAFSSSGGSKKEKGGESLESPEIWEDCWEHGEFPFVRLAENRASCAICLLDFQEPRRRVAREVIQSWAKKNGKSGSTMHDPSEKEHAPSEKDNASPPVEPAVPESSTSQSEPQQEVTEIPIASPTPGQTPLKLEDAGDGAQPLRLLECGHVFHKTCIDPWLTDVSGRCPTCQRPVTIPQQKKSRKRGQQP